MFFTINCPHCSKSLKVRGELVGKSARCPYCRNTVTVTAPDEKPATPEPSAGPVVITSGAASAAPRAAGPSAPAAASRTTGPLSVTPDTDVHVAWHILVGLVGTALFYAALWPFAWTDKKLTYIGRLFIGTSTMAQGGWVPIAEVFLFCWAIGMLVEKWLKIRRQQRSLLYDVLPTGLGAQITLGNLDAFLDHIRGLPKDAVGSFLVTRCVRGLEHFRVRKSAPDTATMLASQSELDASSVDSSYTMFHVFIWAIPILGFLGTVIGVSTAVGSFTSTLEGSSDIAAMKEALKGITGGLATAFDTTLVALAMAMILTFPVSALQKGEGDLVGQVDEYTNENLLRRLEDGREGGAERGLAGGRTEMRRVFEEVLAPHRAELASWGESLKKLGGDMLADIQKGWHEVDARLVAEHGRQAERIAQTERMLDAWSQRLGTIGLEVAAQVKDGWNDVNAKLLEEHGRQSERIVRVDALVDAAQESIRGLAVDAASARERADRSIANAAAGVEAYTASLTKALAGLSEALARLEGRQIVVEAQPVARSWWGIFGGGGGRRS